MIRFDQIEHASLSDVGVRRSHNQDNHAVLLAVDDKQWRQRGHLFLVADGMGAHAVGEKASEQAVGLIPHTYLKYAPQGPAKALRKAFQEANASIHECGQQNREFQGMGTTSTSLLLRPEGAWVGHVGDSRVYRIRGGAIEQLSYDHSLVWEYARIKQIDPDEVQDIPSNVIHRCLGPEALVQVDVEGPHPIQGGDIFLLCSDGLSGPVNNQEMGAIASVLPPAEACRFLVDLANLRGGPDNITVLIVRVPAGPESNGVPAAPAVVRKWLGGPRMPWWVGSLMVGTVFAAGAAYLEFGRMTGVALILFLLASLAILSGLVGLGVQYLREKMRGDTFSEEEELSPPRVHRRASCRIDQPLVEWLDRINKVLRQRAQEKNWETDWSTVETHYEAAEQSRQHSEFAQAFREYCRALLPLMRALEKQRNKEEVFQPLWDRAR